MLLARAARSVASISNVIGRACIRRDFCQSTTNRNVKTNILDTLSSRSLLAQVTAPNSLRKHLQGSEQRTVYVGVDPSADSLHVGNLLPLLAALHFLEHGHRVIVLIGGATGSIGDPSGRDSERRALSLKELNRNIKCITEQVQDFFDRASKLLKSRQSTSDEDVIEHKGEIELTPLQKAAEVRGLFDAEQAAEKAMRQENSGPGDQPSMDGVAGESTEPLAVTVLNNEVWYRNVNILSFLREVGKLARVGKMLARDSVKSRLSPLEGDATATNNGGLSFTEFSYQLLQAYDFSILHRPPWNCTIQMGGSDQMGNIMAGVDLIRRQKAIQDSSNIQEDEEDVDSPAYGLTIPLLTTASGAKFGKSAGNALWLSPSKCSDYTLYQFLFRSRDDEVEVYLKTLTMLSLNNIEKIMQDHVKQPSARVAQKHLASEVLELLRGKEAVKKAQIATTALFDTNLEGLDANEMLDAFQDDKRLVSMQVSGVMGANVTTLVVNTGLVSSRVKARRMVIAGGIYMNNTMITDPDRKINKMDTICDGKMIILRRGRAEHRIVSLS